MLGPTCNQSSPASVTPKALRYEKTSRFRSVICGFEARFSADSIFRFENEFMIVVAILEVVNSYDIKDISKVFQI